MKTKSSNFIATLCLVILSSSSLYARPDTLNEYDENATNTNSYDLDTHNFATYSQSMGDFISSVDSAWNTDLGGVVDFDGDYIISGGGGSAPSVYSTGYGTNGYINSVPSGSLMDFTITNSVADQDISLFTGAVGISLDTNLYINTNSKFDISYASSVGDKITSVGFTILDELIDSDFGFDIEFWDQTAGLAATYTFDDTLSKDQFFGHMSAPGDSLHHISFVNHTKTGSKLFIDDLAFTAVAIPETSTSLLGVMGVLGMALRRRRA